MRSADPARGSIASRRRDHPEHSGTPPTRVLPAVWRSRRERDCIPLEQDIALLSKPEPKLSLEDDDAFLFAGVAMRGVPTCTTRLDDGLQHLEPTCSRRGKKVVLDAPAPYEPALMLSDNRTARAFSKDPGDRNAERGHDASQGRDGGAQMPVLE